MNFFMLSERIVVQKANRVSPYGPHLNLKRCKRSS
jgi:hypothetical protein